MKRVTLCGMLTALALVFNYIEAIVPMPVAIPGIKLGIANIVIVFALYKIGIKEAVVISALRIILAGSMFGNATGVIYSLSGAFLSIVIMIVLKKITDLHIVTISICGAIFHVLGQLLVAGVVVGFEVIYYYAFPVLAAAFIAGAVVGIISSILISRIPIDML